MTYDANEEPLVYEAPYGWMNRLKARRIWERCGENLFAYDRDPKKERNRKKAERRRRRGK